MKTFLWLQGCATRNQAGELRNEDEQTRNKLNKKIFN